MQQDPGKLAEGCTMSFHLLLRISEDCAGYFSGLKQMTRMEMHMTILSHIYIAFHLFLCNQKDVVALLLGTICKSSCLGEKEEELNAFGGEVEGVHVPWTRLWIQDASVLAAFRGGLSKWPATIHIGM